MSNNIEKLNDEFVQDIRELCIFCAKGVVVISKKHNLNPEYVSKMFIEVYNKIQSDVENS